MSRASMKLERPLPAGSSAVSQQLRALEQRHGVTLRHCSTRSSRSPNRAQPCRALPLHVRARGGATEALKIALRITSSSQISLQQMCVAGLGLSFVVSTEAPEELRPAGWCACCPAGRCHRCLCGR